LAAAGSVAPLHVLAALVLVLLPLANAVALTRAELDDRRRRRGARWHDHLSRPAVLARAFVASARVTVSRATVPVLAVAGTCGAGLLSAHVVRHPVPMPVVRVVAGAAVVVVAGWLTRRLDGTPPVPASLPARLVGRVGRAGPVAWALAGGVVVLAVAVPSQWWPLPLSLALGAALLAG
jgi:hypothetical protein